MPLVTIRLEPKRGDLVMRKSIFAALLAVLLLPAFADSESQNSQPYNVTAEAGRTQPGHRWCACGDPAVPNCVCDPDEQPCTVCLGQGLTVQQNAAQESDPINLGATFSLVVGAAFLVLRLRQLI
jgi:hypothetical protein